MRNWLQSFIICILIGIAATAIVHAPIGGSTLGLVVGGASFVAMIAKSGSDYTISRRRR